MAECTDKRYTHLLYAYETGMLSDEDREAFEIHLLECRSCREQALAFQKAGRILRQDPAMRDFVGRLAASDTATAAGPRRSESKRNVWSLVVPVAAVVLLFLLLLDWDIEFSPRKEAIAAEDKVAVLYFDNLVDPADSADLGRIITNLVITDLAESRYVRVVSDQRIADILRSLGYDKRLAVDERTATEVTTIARARWMLVGSIASVEPELVLTAQVIDVTSGDVVGAQRVVGGDDETIFAVVDRLTGEIRHLLRPPEKGEPETDPAVADVTTHSREAYRYYLLGLEDYNRCYFLDAQAKFDSALSHDSTLAMAYYYLALLFDRDMIYKAQEHLGRAGSIDQYYIRSMVASRERRRDEAMDILRQLLDLHPDEKRAHYLLGSYENLRHDYAAARRQYARAIELDSLYRQPYDKLAQLYDLLDIPDSALWAIDKYMALAADEANPYVIKGEILGRDGRLDEAIELFEASLKIKPGHFMSLYNLVVMNIFKHDYVRAAAVSREMMKSPNLLDRSAGRYMFGLIPAHQGLLDSAVLVLDNANDAYRLESDTDGRSVIIGTNLLLKTVIRAEQENFDAALAAFEDYRVCTSYRAAGTPIFQATYLAEVLAASGDVAAATAVADSLHELLLENEMAEDGYWYIMGIISVIRGDGPAALDAFAQFTNPTPSFHERLYTARAHLLAGNAREAVARLEALSTRYSRWRIFWVMHSAKVPFYLARAYEAAGDERRAAAAYRRFLDDWSQADDGLPVIIEARERLARLQSRP